jgi:BolA protein
MKVQDRMEAKLREELAPASMTLVNVSHHHHGHAGSPGTGESHFELHLVSEKFAGLSRIQRHKLVYRILEEEMAGPVHALQLSLQAPSEASS